MDPESVAQADEVVRVKSLPGEKPNSVRQIFKLCSGSSKQRIVVEHERNLSPVDSNPSLGSPAKKKKQSRKGKNRSQSALILVSKRGAKESGPIKCSNCSKIRLSLTRYIESNRGEVVVCDYCKDDVRARSFAKNMSRKARRKKQDAWQRRVRK